MARDHGFHRLRIARVIDETPDAKSFVLEVPEDFRYEAGQFCTFRVGEHLRCYSMSSAPGVDESVQVTVKRVPGGVVSNWMNDSLAAGDEIEASLPSGTFCLRGSGDVVLFAAGSGITPVISLAKQALATTSRRVRLLYANRDQQSTIFRQELDTIPGLEVVHHLDVDRGFVDASTVAPWVDPTAEAYLCGPTPFMDVVEAALLDGGVPPEQIHVERFTPGEAVVEPMPSEALSSRVTITLGGRTESTEHHPGTTLLQTARQAGLAAPSSCEQGNCATCMAMLEEGTVEMRVNDALTEEEVEEGWILTCQAVPTSPTVKVVYES